MMHPSAATVYLATQNRVADELLEHIGTCVRRNRATSCDNGVEIDDLLGLLIKYTMEGDRPLKFRPSCPACLDELRVMECDFVST